MKIKLLFCLGLGLGLFFYLMVSSPSSISHGQTESLPDIERISISTGDDQGNAISWWPAVSADGSLVAFSSEASNLVDSDINGYQDVFVHDRLASETKIISSGLSGQPSNGESGFPDISADGRYIVFQSYASNLVDGDTNGCADIFLFDRGTGLVTLVSISTDGVPADGNSRYPSISADGRVIAFQSAATSLVDSDSNGIEDVFIRDMQTGETTRVSVASNGSQANGWSDQASISPDGDYIAFRSYASNLVPQDDNNYCDTDQDGSYDDNCQDIFLHNRHTRETTMVSVTNNGSQGNNWSGWPAVSAGGKFVVFKSWAEDLVDGDTNAWSDIFLHDSLSGATTRVSVASDGTQADCYSDFPSISASGRYLAFHSCATNLVVGDTNARFDIFLYDRFAHRTIRKSIASDGSQADGDSSRASLSSDARYIAFDSFAANLVTADTNGVPDVFLVDRGQLNNIFIPFLRR